MEDKFLCKHCEEEYDNEDRIPRILRQCGHCLCQKCLQSYLTRGKSIICPVDQVEIPVNGLTLDDFSQNISLMHIISLKNITGKSESSDEEAYGSNSEEQLHQSLSNYGVQ